MIYVQVFLYLLQKFIFVECEAKQFHKKSHIFVKISKPLPLSPTSFKYLF